MTTVPMTVTEARSAVKYTGTNSGEIAALIPDFTVVSEDASGLKFTSGGTEYTVATNGWVTYWQGAVQEQPFANDDDFYDVYRDAAASVHVHDLVLTSGPGHAPEAA